MKFRIPAAIVLAVLFSASTNAQSLVPILSGGAGLLGSTVSGDASLQAVFAPVLAVPIGSRWLIESRADLRSVTHPTNLDILSGVQSFTNLAYGQIDFLATPWLTITAGRFLTPFDIYNERLTPIWIHKFQDAPLIVPIGTTQGSSDGAMVRGSLISRDEYQITYTAYVSVLSNINKLTSERSAGGRTSVFLPQTRLELGVSYGRLLQGQGMNFEGAFLSWQPHSEPLDMKAEYAHSPRGQGYWLEAAYRFTKPRGPDTPLGRLEALGRVQQFERLQPGTGDSLPAVNTQRIDAGVNYLLPHEVRLNATYGRQFSSSGDQNIWDFGVTYRFLFPLFPGGSR
jgi:hypothetical protein